MPQSLLASYSFAIGGIEFATWFFAFETRKTFKGGIFWNAWRLIATSLPVFMVTQLTTLVQALFGASLEADYIGESFEALGTIMLFVGFYTFFKAWNPGLK